MPLGLFTHNPDTTAQANLDLPGDRKPYGVHCRRTGTRGGSLRRMRRGFHLASVLAVVVALFSGGCVQRRMTIRSNPPGALVYIDDYYIGTTPVSTDFIYYGKRKIRLVKDGYEILNVPKYDIPPPWYEVFPLEFVSENVIPWEIRDERVLDFQLAPQMVVPQDQLLARAQQLRTQTQATAGLITTPGGMAPNGTMGAPTYLPPGPTVPGPLPPPVPGQGPSFQPQFQGPSPNPLPLPGRY